MRENMAKAKRDEPYTKPDDFSVSLIEKLYAWHGGQSSPVYSVASMDGDVPVSVVEDASSELSRVLTKIKLKGSGYKRSDIRELEGVIGDLDWIASARAKGHEPV